MADTHEPIRMSTNNKAGRQYLDILLGAVITNVFVLVVWCIDNIGMSFIETLSKSIPSASLIQLILLLSVALGLTLIWALCLRYELRNPLSKHFDFNAYGGYYVDKKSGLGICPHCLSTENPRVVHLMDAGGAKMCNSCDKGFRSNPPTATQK